MAGLTVNPNSGAVGGVVTNGDVSSAVIAYFGEKANDAAKKTHAAIGKAQKDAAANKLRDESSNEMVTDGGTTTVSPNGKLAEFLKGLAARNNTQAKDLVKSMKDGSWTSDETSSARALLNKGLTTAGVNDDAVNMALVQAAFQEFMTATNGMSAVVKKSGDTKDSIANRLS